MTGDPNQCPPSGLSVFLERLTAALLLAVLVVLGWIVAMAYFPAWARLASEEREVRLISKQDTEVHVQLRSGPGRSLGNAVRHVFHR